METDRTQSQMTTLLGNEVLARVERLRINSRHRFTNRSRGEHLYGKPNHDSELFQRHHRAVPLGGFFCNGEIGPVQGQTHLHGYTSSIALFR